MKKTIALIIILATLLAFACSCAKEPNEVTYREEGLEFTLPVSMRATYSDTYDIYFSNPEAIFAAKKLTPSFLTDSNIDPNVSAEEYVDIHLARNGFSKSEQIFYEADRERGAYSFRYTYTESEDVEMFYYVLVLGEPRSLWYVDMCCYYEDSATYSETFGIWARTVKTYTVETETMRLWRNELPLRA